MWRVPGSRFEWPTIWMLGLCYGAWVSATWFMASAYWWAWIPVAVFSVTLHSSLQHEATHGHPTDAGWLNAALVFPALGLFMPYGRFLSLHRAHHRAAALADPVLDTESFFLTPKAWARTPRALRLLLMAQNTLVGRLVLGPAIALLRFYRADLAAIRAGRTDVVAAWLWHLPAVAGVLVWVVWVCGLDPFLYALIAYAGYGVVMVRTFAEHRAHPDKGARTVVIEDRGLLSWLFLNNNLHAVHHRHPAAPWYALPAIYAGTRSETLARNGGYRYDSYWDLARRFAFRMNQPVAYPPSSAADG